MKRLAFLILFLLWAMPAWAVNSTITGTVTNIDGTNCANCTVTFNSVTTQVISGITYQPRFASTTTDANGNLAAITLPQGLAVQITVSEGGTTFPSYTAIVPFISSVTFNQMNQGITTNPLNVLASNQPPTGPLNMNGQKITNQACPSTTGDSLTWACNATIANLTVTGTFNQTGTSGENFFGLLTVNAIGTPIAPVPTAVGATGSTSYYYFAVCHDGNGGATLPSPSGNVANANATLTLGNYVSVAFTLPTNAVNCDILRNTSNTTAGAQSITGGLALKTSPVLDTSNTTAVYTLPTRNTTGDGQFAGAVSAGTPTTGILTGDLSASRAAGTGLLWLGSNGSQSLDFGITNASKFTLLGGGLVLPAGGLTLTTGNEIITAGNETITAGNLAVTAGTITGGSSATLGVNGTAGGSVVLNGASSGSATLAVPAAAGTPAVIDLPSTTGTLNQALITNGASPQVTSWSTVPMRANLQTGNPLATATNTATAFTMATFTLPGGSLGASGVMHCHLEGNFLDNTGGATNYELMFTYGGGATETLAATTITQSANPIPWIADITLATVGITGTEWFTGMLTNPPQGYANGGTNSGTSVISQTRDAAVTVDSTVNQTVLIQGKMQSNTSTQTLNVFESYCQLQ